MHRIVIMGNSGAGKSTLAGRLARSENLAHLDLDTLAWLPEAPPRRAPHAESFAKIRAFVDASSDWVIDGCYSDLLAEAIRDCTLLLFLDPGIEVCLAHCRARPWEPHKYESAEAQDANLPMLLDWVRGYETRTDEFSRASHVELFDAFAGEKRRFTDEIA